MIQGWGLFWVKGESYFVFLFLVIQSFCLELCWPYPSLAACPHTALFYFPFYPFSHDVDKWEEKYVFIWIQKGCLVANSVFGLPVWTLTGSWVSSPLLFGGTCSSHTLWGHSGKAVLEYCSNVDLVVIGYCCFLPWEKHILIKVRSGQVASYPAAQSKGTMVWQMLDHSMDEIGRICKLFSGP